MNIRTWARKNITDAAIRITSLGEIGAIQPIPINDGSTADPNSNKPQFQERHASVGTPSKVFKIFPIVEYNLYSIRKVSETLHQYPHSHDYGNAGNHNYCRNPSNYAGGAWCYVDNRGEKQFWRKRWELCGRVSITLNGRTCQSWDSQYPHKHSQWGFGNQCHNPDHTEGGTGQWCYTTDPNVRWEWCPAENGYASIFG